MINDELDSPGVPKSAVSAVMGAGLQEMEQWPRIIELVRFSGVYNKDSCRIQVNHNWNFDLLQSMLVDYHDYEIVDLLKFGWPIDRDMNIPLELGGINHKGATCFENHVDDYINNEIKLGATIGPFECIPFRGAVAASPLVPAKRKIHRNGESFWIAVGRWEFH